MKINELTGAALDRAVAICQNVELDENDAPIWFDDNDARVTYSPSTDWAQGGLIIEREGMDIFKQLSTGEWCGSLPRRHKVGWRFLQYGPTPLIAAMRCYVASKLGAA